MKNKIILGSCLDIDIPGEAFLISDPPYNQKYHYESYADDLKEIDYYELLFKIFHDRKAVIIHYPEETINLLGGGNLGLCQQVVSWVYPSNTGKQSRLITWWNCKPDMTKVKQPYKNPIDKRIAERIARGEEARLYDWWEIDQVKNVSDEKTEHPCPMPLELMKRIILITTEPNDLIVDPFCGSGTTCVAAKQTGRNYLGIEIDPKYVKIAQDRLKQDILL